MPAITAVIPVLNRAHIIKKTIASVLGQDVPADYAIKIIVVDDGSSDDLAGGLRPFGSRVSCICHDKNSGAAAARNTGAKAAQGDYLAFLDSDDTWLPNKLATQIAFMQANNYAVSCTACARARAGASDIVWPRYATGRLTLADIAWGCILSPGTTMVCESRMFEEIGPFDTTIKRREDWDWLLRLTLRYDLGYLATPLAYREPSAFSNYRQGLDDIERLRAKHGASLPLPVRRSFEAALAFETAAASYRQGKLGTAFSALARSLWLVPVGNAAVNAYVAGRLARR